MAPKLTVIIPVHNAAKIIKKTAQKILCQDYENLELILIENGSEDNSLGVCQSVSIGDNRCIVFHNNEKSTLLARKTGIDHASGDYICFSDADDSYRNRGSLRRMVEAIERTNVDIVLFGNIINQFGMKTQRLRVKEEEIITRSELFKNEIAGVMGGYNQKIDLNVWGKIYRTRVLKSISKDLSLPLINAEDLYLNCCAFFSEETQKIAFVPICEYVYNAGIGVSGNGIYSAEKMFIEYQFFKSKALEFALKNNINEHSIYLCHSETLYYLYYLIQGYIERGDSKENVKKKIEELWAYPFVEDAKGFFVNYAKEHDLYTELLFFAKENNPENYYDYCLKQMGNLAKRKIIYKGKHIIKTVLRKLKN